MWLHSSGHSVSFFFTFIRAGCDPLQGLVNSLEKKIDETEKKFEETSRLSEERLKQATEAESKIIELKTTMQRFFLHFCQIRLGDTVDIYSVNY